ncbi:MAG: TfoX/Sxy family protein [Alphaproteobacteria bacterium]|nr:TfoX/Sxy family protein [Alphaproteobacteria bacterium]MDE1985806.1 TfoX/Sxy family protein [Alphaproteobacteria bacterium]MDE2163681.1 TfoX/Sxy family protein [Alphaproteobacteria bacterium]MDE2264346.1 TfoX/Sxy family protein [Alphaproteobacteria bacterium]MDE2499265.1 TfoX/Sxy family protein [Alphaproteobacteria bacterium]
MRAGPQPFRPDLFASYGNVYAKRMFGGHGLFAGDAMLGFVSDDLIYLKTNEDTRAAFLAEGCKPFVYRKRSTGEEVALSYYQIPERLYDEPEEFADWVRRAQTVAENSPSVQRKRRLTAKHGRPTGKKPPRR